MRCHWNWGINYLTVSLRFKVQISIIPYIGEPDDQCMKWSFRVLSCKMVWNWTGQKSPSSIFVDKAINWSYPILFIRAARRLDSLFFNVIFEWTWFVQWRMVKIGNDLMQSDSLKNCVIFFIIWRCKSTEIDQIYSTLFSINSFLFFLTFLLENFW